MGRFVVNVGVGLLRKRGAVPVLSVKRELEQGFGAREESGGVPNGLIVSKVFRVNHCLIGEGFEGIWVDKPGPHLVFLRVWVTVNISSRGKSESIDSHLGSSN